MDQAGQRPDAVVGAFAAPASVPVMWWERVSVKLPPPGRLTVELMLTVSLSPAS